MLRFRDELRSDAKLDVPDEVKLEKKQLELAKELINKMADEFRYEQYKDEYADKVMGLVERKIQGKRIVAPRAPKAPPVKDLMDALRKSLKAA